MKTIASLCLLIFICLFSFDVIATGLQDYLQNTPATTGVEETSQAVTSLTTPTATDNAVAPISNSPLTYIIELVVAGIVASALIISVLVLFLGRWAANKEKRLIKELRIEAESEKEHVISAAASIREKEQETNDIVHKLQNKTSQLSSKIDLADKNNERAIEVTEKVIQQEKELKEVTAHISTRMDDIQDYWSDQLNETISVIGKVQSGLDENLAKVDNGIETMQEQKEVSQELLQDFLNKHKEQEEIISSSSKISKQVTKSLEKTFEESNKLLELLKQHQVTAEKSLQSFAKELTVYEEQAYEQFDSTFQVADLARQELTANIDESRKHIETMRRHEEQSHNINTQTQKNLELLDYSKIMKLSTTLDSTHDMFTDIRSRVDETKSMLEELKDIKTEIKEMPEKSDDNIDADEPEATSNDINTQEADDDDNNNQSEQPETIYDTEYKMASGDFTPLSFFKNIKQKNTSTDS